MRLTKKTLTGLVALNIITAGVGVYAYTKIDNENEENKSKIDVHMEERLKQERSIKVLKEEVDMLNDSIENMKKEMNELNIKNEKLLEDNKKLKEIQVYEVEATAYSYARFDEHHAIKWGDKNARGGDLAFGQIAVDTKVFPLGTKFYIEGFGGQVFTATDTGNAIKGMKIDVFLDNREDMIQFGRRKLRVQVIS